MLCSLTLAAVLSFSAAAVADSEAPPEAAPLTREESWAQLGPEALYQQALAFQAEGRRSAALERLAWLQDNHPDPLVTFQIGKTLELDEDYAGALAAYDDVLAGGDEELREDAAFRRAIVLEDLGRHKESLRQIRALEAAGQWSEAEAVSLALCRGISELYAGRSRRGIRRLEAGLAALEGSTEQTWMRARARTALASYLLAEAAALELKGDKRAARRLSARTDLMSAAEKQVVAIARLGETEYILIGLQQLGDSYLRLHDDMLAAPTPRKLDEVQALIYAETLADHAGILRRKAKIYYDRGLQLADEVGWQGSARDELAARSARL